MRNVTFFAASFLMLALHVSGQNLIEKYSVRGFAKARYSPDKSLLAVADKNNIKLYTAGTSTLVRNLTALNSPITALDFSAAGDKIIVGGLGKKARIIHAVSGATIHEIVLDTKPIRFNYDQTEAIEMIDQANVAIIYGETLKVVELETGKIVIDQTFDVQLRALAADSRSGVVYVAGKDGVIQGVNIHTSEKVQINTASKAWIKSMDVSPDGKSLAVGYHNAKAELFDLQTGEKAISFPDLKGIISDVEFSGDGKYLALTSEKGACKVYSMEKEFYTLNLSGIGHQAISASFNLNGKELATVNRNHRVKTWNVEALNISPVFRFKDEKDNTAPQIFVSNPPNIKDDRYRFSQDIIRIAGTVMDESGVRQLRINGRNTPIRDNGNFVINMPLQMGDNFISIEAIDVNDNTALKKFVVNRKDLDGEDYDPLQAKNYLFVVGINDYDYWPKLFNAVRDANDVATTLMSSYGFQFDHVIMLKNEQATRSNIYNSLRTLISQVGPKDNLMIYYSGHGHFDELLNEGYWIPADAKLNAPGEYLSNSDILKIIGNINSQHTFLVADACFSGSLFAEPSRGYVENVEKYRSRWGLASGRLETVSDGTEGKNSPFATNFIQFLKENDKESFPVSELVQYVKVKVAEVSDQTPLGNPLKGAGDEGGEFIFHKK